MTENKTLANLMGGLCRRISSQQEVLGLCQES